MIGVLPAGPSVVGLVLPLVTACSGSGLDVGRDTMLPSHGLVLKTYFRGPLSCWFNLLLYSIFLHAEC